MGFVLVLAYVSAPVGRFRGDGGVFQLFHRAVSQQNLVDLRRVKASLCVDLVAGDRLDYVEGALRLGRAPG